jgi:hypothetical protein
MSPRKQARMKNPASVGLREYDRLAQGVNQPAECRGDEYPKVIVDRPVGSGYSFDVDQLY